MKNKVCVIIPNYNGRGLLPACLDSLLAQKPVPPDIIVVDNCSNDGSAEIISHKYPGVTLVEMKNNAGFTAAARQGLRASRHEFVVIMNNDTVVPPGWLVETVEKMQHEEAGRKKGRRTVMYYVDQQGMYLEGAPAAAVQEAPAAELNTQNARLRAALASRSSQLDKANRKISALEKKVARLDAKAKSVSKITYDKAIAEGRISNLQQRIADLNRELQESSSGQSALNEVMRQKTVLANVIKEKNRELELASKRLANLEKVILDIRHDNSSTSALKTDISVLELKVKDLENQLAAREAGFEEAMAAREAEYQRELAAKQAENEKALDRVAELMITVTKLSSERAPAAALETESERTAELKDMIRLKNSLLNDASDLVAELVENVSILSKENKEIPGLKEEIERLQGRISELETVAGEKDAEIAKSREYMTHLEQPGPAIFSGYKSLAGAAQGSIDTDGAAAAHDRYVESLREEYEQKLEQKSGEIEHAREKIGKLKEEIDVLTEKTGALSSLDAENEALKIEIAKLEKQLEQSLADNKQNNISADAMQPAPHPSPEENAATPQPETEPAAAPGNTPDTEPQHTSPPEPPQPENTVTPEEYPAEPASPDAAPAYELPPASPAVEAMQAGGETGTEAPGPPPIDIPADDPGDDPGQGATLMDAELDEILMSIQSNPTPEELLKLRQHLDRKELYEDGIRILKQVYAEGASKGLLPAISLLIGEMYLKIGRDDESTFYLSNPLISYDKIACELLDRIDLKLPAQADAEPPPPSSKM